jgi:hypothetical protein
VGANSIVSDNDEYRNNHYVPQWYQQRFLKPFNATNFHVLDLKPDTFRDRFGRLHNANELHRLGTKKAFRKLDLYTTKFGIEHSTEIEQRFFGPIDRSGPSILDFWEKFEHPNWSGEAFEAFLPLVSLQKLRTPKGLEALADLTAAKGNDVLFAMQKFQNLHCAHWTEAVWSIVDAPRSTPGFLLSDHPVTVYNSKCFPGSPYCMGYNDPPIWANGSQTIFPISPYRAFLLSNLSWVRNPYGNALEIRPNPNPLRTAMFNFQSIQTGRMLSEAELHATNYVIKQRAYRYIACVDEGWLYPEEKLDTTHWSKFGAEWLFMPDPRGVSFSTKTIIGWEGGKSSHYDEYGHRPWQSGFDDTKRSEKEWDSFHRFQGEFAAKYGPRRRGRSFEFGRLSKEEDDPEFHEYHLEFARRPKAKRKS